MIDMAQADRTLRRGQAISANPFPNFRRWTDAMQRAATELGYAHWLDTPSEFEDPTFIRLARQYHRVSMNESRTGQPATGLLPA